MPVTQDETLDGRELSLCTAAKLTRRMVNVEKLGCTCCFFSSSASEPRHRFSPQPGFGSFPHVPIPICASVLCIGLWIISPCFPCLRAALLPVNRSWSATIYRCQWIGMPHRGMWWLVVRINMHTIFDYYYTQNTYMTQERCVEYHYCTGLPLYLPNYQWITRAQSDPFII